MVVDEEGIRIFAVRFRRERSVLSSECFAIRSTQRTRADAQARQDRYRCSIKVEASFVRNATITGENTTRIASIIGAFLGLASSS